MPMISGHYWISFVNYPVKVEIVGRYDGLADPPWRCVGSSNGFTDDEIEVICMIPSPAELLKNSAATA